MNHAKSPGVWLRMFRKNSGEKTISHDEALDEALCYGWIDGQADKYDEKSWIQKFTPRRSKSVWSKRNRERVEMLIKEKRMKPAGFHQVAAAKKDGRWDQAYDSPKNMAIPNDSATVFPSSAYRDARLTNWSPTCSPVIREYSTKIP